MEHYINPETEEKESRATGTTRKEFVTSQGYIIGSGVVGSFLLGLHASMRDRDFPDNPIPVLAASLPLVGAGAWTLVRSVLRTRKIDKFTGNVKSAKRK